MALIMEIKKTLDSIALDISEPEYRAMPELSYSTLSTYEKLGYDGLEHLFDKKESPSLTLGSMVDAILTGGEDEFNERFTLFGANLGKTPTLHPDSWTKEAIILCAVPFLAGLSQLLVSFYSQMHQKKTNPVDVPGGGCMAVMMYGMPLLSIWFAFQVPAGVGFYWIWSSVFSFVITLALNCYFTPERTKVINEKEKEKARIYAEKHPNKKTFMQKMLEQQAALEQQNNGGSSSGKANGLSRSEQNKQNRDKLKEARRRMAEKYGDSYEDNDDED